jgi:hypothetical protein
LHDRERKKECEKDRRRGIKEQADESDKDDWHKQWYGGSIQDERRKCSQHEHEEDAADHAAEEVVLAELAKHQKPTPDHALVANDTNNVVIEKDAAAIQVVKPSNNALAPAFEPISMFEVTPMKNCLKVSWEILTCSCLQY